MTSAVRAEQGIMNFQDEARLPLCDRPRRSASREIIEKVIDMVAPINVGFTCSLVCNYDETHENARVDICQVSRSL